MEPPQLIKEELLAEIKEFFRKPENIGFVAGFGLTIVLIIAFINKLYKKKNSPQHKAHEFKEGSKKKKEGIFDAVLNASLEYGMIFFLTLIKDYITEYLTKVDESISEHQEEITGE